MVLGGTGGGQNCKRIFEKTGVGVGRPELSLRAIGTTFCALSSGHGPRGLGFQGGSLRWISMFLLVSGEVAAKSPDNKQKSQRNH